MNVACAFNIALDTAPPEWVELLPPGPDIVGEDGRAWTLPDPSTVVVAFARRGKPLVIDWEHATEHRAPQGLDAPAAGWIDQMEVRNGAVWGHAEWTDKAAAQIAAREYRFLSPVFTYEKAGARIVSLSSAGMTNTPNLTMTALNRASHEELPMPLPPALCAALEVPSTATDDEAIAAAVAIQQRLGATATDLAAARNRAETPPLEKFVPRADYDAALARATNAEQQIQALNAQQRTAQVDTLIQKALADGKILPVTQDYYRAMCKTEDGIAEFEKFLAKSPPIIGGESKLGGKPTPGAASGALTDTQRAICQVMGINPADYAKNLAKEAA